MYDLIGDIHGHADELVALLQRMHYTKSGDGYRHSERKVIFLGDFIDRGPKIRETLEIVRAMTAAGDARAVMGNHELNALAYHTADRDYAEMFLRPHEEKNTRQHQATLNQLSSPQIDEALDWFRTLPLWLELDGLRAIHACWDDACLRRVADGLARYGGVTDAFLHAACRKDGALFHDVETLLKGKEMKLPDGITYTDKDGHVRDAARVKWYLPPHGETVATYAMNSSIECKSLLAADVIAAAAPYPAAAPPLFLGHYWLEEKQPLLWAPNVACLDYSVAKQGYLCAYRWNGEQTLDAKNFEWVRA